jgi:hypothetical protein
MPFVKKFFLASIIVLLLTAAYTSGRWAVASLLETQVRHQLGKTGMVGKEFDAKQWRLTYDMLQTVLKLHPNYSSYLELTVFFYQVAETQSPTLLDELEWYNTPEQALNYTRDALLKRPSWPYLWNELFAHKVINNQFDNELTGAMERAATLGKWEYYVQFQIAFTGLENWENLPITGQKIVLKTMEQTLLMKKYPEPLHKYMQKKPNINKLCESVIADSNYTSGNLWQFCQRLPK